MKFRQLARRIHHFLEIYGLDGQKFVTSVRNTPHFLRTLSACGLYEFTKNQPIQPL